MTRGRLAAALLVFVGFVLAATLPEHLTDSSNRASAVPADTGWIGSVTAAYGQQTGASLSLPANFASAGLLVAIVANDGPDSNTTETHAVFGGDSGLTWTRHAHVSARQDWAAPGDGIDLAGASSAEIWTATPSPGWHPRVVTEISNHPESTAVGRDDGGIITIAAWSNGRLGQILTLDGLNSRPEHQRFDTLGPASSVYAAVFNGRANANFTPLAGFHTAAGVVRRAGDDTAQVIASDNRNLPAGSYDVGYAPSPSPGDYWEMAIVEVVLP
jgi:hypothetical protein